MGEYHKSQEESLASICCAIDVLCDETKEGFGELVNQLKILNSSLLQMTAMLKDIAFNTGE